LPLVKAHFAIGFTVKIKRQKHTKRFAQFKAVTIIIANDRTIACRTVFKFKPPQGKL